MTEVAFAPRAAHKDASFGVIYVNDQTDFNVGEALEQGGGYIVTADPVLINALNERQPALKQVPMAEVTRQHAEDALGDLTKEQLLEQPEAARIDGAKSMKVDELRVAVQAERDKNEGTV